MTVLVTGASGFIGKILLHRNQHFDGIDKYVSDSNVMECNVLDTSNFGEIIQSRNIDTIVHLAGVQYTEYIKPKNRYSFFDENVKMAEKIVELSILNNIKKIIYISTDMVYGMPTSSQINEESMCRPIGEYGESKLKAERIFSQVNNLIDVCIIRPRLVVGPGRKGTLQSLSRLVKSPFPIIFIGNGYNRYQFISVNDLCSFIELATTKNISGIFNIGSDNPPNLNSLFESVLHDLKIKKLIIRVPSKFANSILGLLDFFSVSPLAPEQYRIASLDYVLDTSKAKSQYSWKPTVSDTTILRETIFHNLKGL
jgi:dTDP-glucose 4,6-dehydratase